QPSSATTQLLALGFESYHIRAWRAASAFVSTFEMTLSQQQRYPDASCVWGLVMLLVNTYVMVVTNSHQSKKLLETTLTVTLPKITNVFSFFKKENRNTADKVIQITGKQVQTWMRKRCKPDLFGRIAEKRRRL
ncbi:unnamed protein product, partial [Amoebophrya sp. A25]